MYVSYEAQISKMFIQETQNKFACIAVHMHVCMCVSYEAQISKMLN